MKYLDSIIQQDMKLICDEQFLKKIEKNSSIMITGCNGMIATYLTYFFLYLNDVCNFNVKIFAITRSYEKSINKYSDILSRADFKIIKHDVNDEFTQTLAIDYIFHLASNADPKNILERPVDIIKSNTVGLLNVLDFAKRVNSKRVIFASTREVYGLVDSNLDEVKENDLGIIDQLGTRACYPESKRMAECLLNSYSLQYGVPYTMLRIAHAYGPGMPILKDGRIMSDLISNVVNSENIVLKSDGSAIRAFIYISDMVAGMLFATFCGESNEVFNLANEKENISILQLAKLLVSLFPTKHLKVEHQKITAKEKEAYCKFRRVSLNTEKLESLGWTCKVTLKKGLKSTVDSYEK